MNTNEYKIRIIVLVLLCVRWYSCNVTDFTYFPEDKSKVSDFTYKSGEIFYQAYFFPVDASVTLTDYLNGNLIHPFSNAVIIFK
jgi:hypothetical protein